MKKEIVLEAKEESEWHEIAVKHETRHERVLVVLMTRNKMSNDSKHLMYS